MVFFYYCFFQAIFAYALFMSSGGFVWNVFYNYMEVLKFDLPVEVRSYLREKKIPKDLFFLLASLLFCRRNLDRPESLRPDTDFENDLGMDSLCKLQLVMDIERVFDILIADDMVEHFDTVADVLEYLVKKASKVPEEFSLQG